MNRSVVFVLSGYFFVAVVVIGVLFGLKYKAAPQRSSAYVRLTTISDPAFYNEFLPVRFYSLSDMSALYNDPLIPKETMAGYVIRVKR